MAHIIELPTHTDQRGSLTVLENQLPFSIKRVYWIYDVNSEQVRGGHRHHETIQAMVCLHGQAVVIVKKHDKEEVFLLDKPNKVLLLEPEDWHQMQQFKNNAILFVAASHEYDAKDYICEVLA